MDSVSHLAALDKLKVRIRGLRAKTTANGCTEDEALSAAAKVAELLDRHDLSLSDIELREKPCERRVYETHRKKRIPLDDCIGDIAEFCDCRVWREKNRAGEGRYVFFGLRSDVEVAHYLTEVIDTAVRTELGRYKTSSEYQRFRHQERHLANASFALGMVVSIADRDVEQLIRARVSEAFSQDGFLGEEYGLNEGTSGYTWVVDPIDGTSPFVNGMPNWCVSIAVLKDGEPVIGVIQAPCFDEL